MRIVFILALALNGLAASVSAQTGNGTTSLTELNTEVRDDIARICLPVQYRDGSVAYRNCVKEQISQRIEISRVDELMDTFSSLSFDDRYAIQQACGSTARSCTATQISELMALPEPDTDNITSDEQYVMQQTCFHAQSKQGAAAFRQCQLDEIASIRRTNRPDFTGLSTIDRNALQLTCSADRALLANYRTCLLDGIDRIRKNTLAAASRNTDGDAAAGNTANNTANNTAAPAAETTVTTTAASLQTPDPQSLPSSTEALVTAATTVRISTNPVAHNRASRILPNGEPALAKAIDSQASVQAPVQAVEPDAPMDEPQAQSGTGTAATTTLDSDTSGNSADTGPDSGATASAVDSGGINETDTGVESDQGLATGDGSIVSTLTDIKNRAVETVEGLSTQGKLLLAAVVLMPFALLALLTGRRRSDPYYDDDVDYGHEDLVSRVRATPEPDFRNARVTDDISMDWDAQVDSLFDDPPSLRPDTAPPLQRPAERDTRLASQAVPKPPSTPKTDYSQVDEYAPTRLISPVPAAAPPIQPAPQTIAAQSNFRPMPVAAQSGFANWLHTVPQEEQTSLAIEFMLYWIAFGDERFEPSLKQKIFTDPNPSNKDIVKRWVLKQDVHAFSDTVDWLQRHTTGAQKVQIVRLLMAMLVNGHEPTPVQNTVFRFLGDALYFDNPTLEEMFEDDFQASLPSMPRADRMAWWDRQSAGTVASWNARKLNNSDEITRLAAQLGVDGDARSEHVESAYELAARRCDVERFDHLGPNEHQMIAVRLQRLQQARDGLLEALA